MKRIIEIAVILCVMFSGSILPNHALGLTLTQVDDVMRIDDTDYCSYDGEWFTIPGESFKLFIPTYWENLTEEYKKQLLAFYSQRSTEEFIMEVVACFAGDDTMCIIMKEDWSDLFDDDEIRAINEMLLSLKSSGEEELVNAVINGYLTAFDKLLQDKYRIEGYKEAESFKMYIKDVPFMVTIQGQEIVFGTVLFDFEKITFYMFDFQVESTIESTVRAFEIINTISDNI